MVQTEIQHASTEKVMSDYAGKTLHTQFIHTSQKAQSI